MQLVDVYNPFGIGLTQWVALYFVKQTLLGVWDRVVDLLVRASGAPKLATDGSKTLERLEFVDYAYLTINSVIEYVFLHGLFWYMLNSPLIARSAFDVTVFNTFPALFLMFAVDDLFYTPCHLLMHMPPLYEWVHKHHHRQRVPTRGYPDAGNEHPIEQFVGLGCVWGALLVVPRVTGLHAGTVFVYFSLYAALAMLNHMRYDVKFSWLGFKYTVRAHEMHHRFPRCNYAQYFMFYDKLLGTFRDYVPPKKAD